MIVSIVQIYYISALRLHTDLLNSLWRVIVCGQIVQVTSILTSTIPFLKHFLLSLETGFLSAHDTARTVTSSFDSMGKARDTSTYIELRSQQIIVVRTDLVVESASAKSVERDQ